MDCVLGVLLKTNLILSHHHEPAFNVAQTSRSVDLHIQFSASSSRRPALRNPNQLYHTDKSLANMALWEFILASFSGYSIIH